MEIKCYRCAAWPCECRDGIALIHGDCRQVLPHLSRCDVVLTDMPYGQVNRESGGLRSLDKGNADTLTVHPIVVADMCASKADSVYVFCGTEQVSDLRREFVRQGLSTRLGVWEKSNPSPMNGEHLWLSSIEACVFARRNGAYFGRHCQSPVWRGPTEDKPQHPTQKPLWLFSYLLSSSCGRGGIAIDPFCGSGTTLVAAKAAGCRAIGIELEKPYVEVAANRLRQGVLGLSD